MAADLFREKDVPDQSGKVFLITGANSGIGYEAARALAAQGGRVLLGCYSESRAQNAIARILAIHPSADIDFVPMDLSDLTSIQKAAALILKENRLDVLINNAGIMIPPYMRIKERTQDGFESQFGVNHLGHFALTGLLLPKLQEQQGARIVTVSSIAHKSARMDFTNLNAQTGDRAGQRYGMSKLANLLFAYELDRRLKHKQAKAISVSCHPGIAATEIMRRLPVWFPVIKPVMHLIFNTAAQGAWPILCAAVKANVAGGDYYGPLKRWETTGPAKKVKPAAHALDKETAKQLWEESIKLTGIDPNL